MLSESVDKVIPDGSYGKGHTSDDISALPLSLLSELFTASLVKTDPPALDPEGKVCLGKGCLNPKPALVGLFGYAPLTFLMDIRACVLLFKTDKLFCDVLLQLCSGQGLANM